MRKHRDQTPAAPEFEIVVVHKMLGVTRPSVSAVANTLQMSGLMAYRRGNIRLLDVGGLRDASCECYITVRDHYERLLTRSAPR